MRSLDCRHVVNPTPPQLDLKKRVDPVDAISRSVTRLARESGPRKRRGDRRRSLGPSSRALGRAQSSPYSRSSARPSVADRISPRSLRSGRTKLESSSRVPPSGGWSITISVRESGMPTLRFILRLIVAGVVPTRKSMQNSAVAPGAARVWSNGFGGGGWPATGADDLAKGDARRSHRRGHSGRCMAAR
jgi:hypothetical protein